MSGPERPTWHSAGPTPWCEEPLQRAALSPPLAPCAARRALGSLGYVDRVQDVLGWELGHPLTTAKEYTLSPWGKPRRIFWV